MNRTDSRQLPKLNGFGRGTREAHSFGYGYKSYNSSDHRLEHSAQTRKAGSLLVTTPTKDQPGKIECREVRSDIGGGDCKPHKNENTGNLRRRYTSRRQTLAYLAGPRSRLVDRAPSRPPLSRVIQLLIGAENCQNSAISLTQTFNPFLSLSL